MTNDKILTLTMLTPKQAIQPQPPSGATFLVAIRGVDFVDSKSHFWNSTTNVLFVYKQYYHSYLVALFLFAKLRVGA